MKPIERVLVDALKKKCTAEFIETADMKEVCEVLCAINQYEMTEQLKEINHILKDMHVDVNGYLSGSKDSVLYDAAKNLSDIDATLLRIGNLSYIL